MSDPTLVVVLAVAGAILLVAYLADRSARSGTPPKQLETETAEPLHPLVRELGLTKLDAGEIRGEIEGARVRVLLASSPVNFSVSLDGVPSDLNLVEEPGVLFRRLGSADMATGDLGFDDAIRVAGPHDEALAVLTAETRHAVQYEIVRHSFVVEHGEVRWAARAFTSGDELVEIVRAAITLAKRLRLDRTETASRLANNLTAESVPGVRVRLLQTLGLVFPEHAETQRAARRAAVDPVVAVRIAAANIASGPQAVTLLKALALDPAADDESRAAALAGSRGSCRVRSCAKCCIRFCRRDPRSPSRRSARPRPTAGARRLPDCSRCSRPCTPTRVRRPRAPSTRASPGRRPSFSPSSRTTSAP